MRTPYVAFMTAVCLGLAGPALAAGNDQHFASEAAQGGLAEVEMGQLAQQKAASPAVKQFGQTLAQDHTQANQELRQAAQQENMTLPAQPSESQRTEKQALQKLSGAAFDRAFIQGEIKDHQKDIALFKQEAEDGKSGPMKAFAQKSLPVLQKHLQIAQSLAGKE